jgi:AraC-like DNA-binding protein
MRTTTSVAWVLPHLIAFLAAAGHDPAPLRQLPGVRRRDISDPDLRVADAVLAEAWRLARQATGDDLLGLHFAQAVPAGALDLLEYAFRSSPTLVVALQQIVRFGRVMRDRASTDLVCDGDRVMATWEGVAPLQRVDFAAAFLVRLVREATGSPVAPLEVSLTHASLGRAEEYRSFFQSRVRFDQPSNCLVLAASDAARPLRSADPALAGVVRRRLEKMLAQVHATGDSTADRVRRVLLPTLARGEPTAAEVSRELGLSQRTLQRQLQAEDTSFTRILDSAREEVARALLREPGVGIAEIAFLLGYSEPAAFHRSFRRWTGQTPLVYRRASMNS